jgi:hypothetical protein
MNYAEQEMVANNPFTLSSMATTIEERVGRVMLKAERKAGHVGKAPLSTVIGKQSIQSIKSKTQKNLRPTS